MDEQAYWSKEVSKQLEIAPVTLRKWSIALEAEGYMFLKDENGRRAYRERDIVELLKLKGYLSKSMSMENAIKALFITLGNDSRTLPVLQKNEDIMRSLERSHSDLIEVIKDEFESVRNELQSVKDELAATRIQMARLESDQHQRSSRSKLLKFFKL